MNKYKITVFFTIIFLALTGLSFYLALLKILLIPIIIAFVLGFIAGIYVSRK